MSSGKIRAANLLTLALAFAYPATSVLIPRLAHAASTDMAQVAGQTVNVRHLLPAYDPHLDIVPPPAKDFGTGKIWHVGPNEPYKSFAAIAPQLGTGDIVEIDAATYGCSEQSIIWHAKDITVVGVGGRPVFDMRKCPISGDKGIFNPRGVNMIIDNIEFAGAAGPSGNDAGIRLDGGGYVYITNDYFYDNQDGALLTPDKSLTGPINTDIVVDHSEFADNGTGTGQTHNIYVSVTPHSFDMRFSYSHGAKVGHEVKSRATINYILYNRLADEANGDASYELDLPQGGLSYIVGNVIQKGPNAQNGSNITFSVESPTAPTNPIQQIYVANNTIVNEDSRPSIRHVLFIKNNGLTKALLVNNLIVGVPKSQLAVGSGADKVQSVNNIFTNRPGFYDEANRVYQLTASSPAVNAGVNPGSSEEGFSLVPYDEFIFPHGGQPRPTEGTLDVGAYEYVPGQAVTPAPTVTLTTAHNPINFNTGATLNWTTTNASYCTASGGWFGPKPTRGGFTTAPLTSNQSYSISCTGPDGTASASVSVTVNDSAQAQALGSYTWKDIPHSALVNVCAAGGCTARVSMATGVYVPNTNSWYLMGGSENRWYFGNEVYAFNLTTMKPERITNPTNLTTVKEYNPKADPPYPYVLAACSRALRLPDGSVVPANAGITGHAAWDPIIKKIVLGPWAYQRETGCTGNSSYLTDQWTFDPFTKRWAQIEGPDPAYQSTMETPWFIDPTTGIGYSGGARNIPGVGGSYLINYNTTPPKKVLVDNAWPFGSHEGSIAIDTTHHYALQLIRKDPNAPAQVGLYNLNELSMTKYGTNGSPGTTGAAGGPGPLFAPDASWTVTGDTTILLYNEPSLTFNPKLDMFVAWAGTDKVYFVQLNYKTKTANIISKRIPGGPTSRLASSYAGMSGFFTYVPKLDAYLAFTGLNKDFYLLVPPNRPSTHN